MSRAIPVVMDAGALSEAAAKAAAEAHAHDDDPSQPLPGPAPVLLLVGGEPISEADVAREMQFHRAADPHASRRMAARTLVVRALVQRECQRLGLVAEPEGAETAEEALVRQLLEREVETPVPDEAACRQYFEANQGRLHHPDRVLARHILLAAPPADIKARERAMVQGEELLEALRAEPDRFGEFAMRHSACPSREQGGELGWLERGDTVPEFDRQLFMLREGLAGLTVETRYGHHVVAIDRIERGAPMTWEEARPRIEAYLETQVQQNAVHQYLQILVERYGVDGLDLLDAAA
jgi:peptidyl-prolyl cis-trans isomerase C